MAIHGALRYKPDIYQTALETTIAEIDLSTTPPTGVVVRTAQLVLFDDAVTTGANYKPGDPATERNLCLVDQTPIMIDLASFAGKTAEQCNKMWTDALNAWGQPYVQHGGLLVNALWGSSFLPPLVIA